MDVSGPHEEKRELEKILSFHDPSATYTWEYKSGRWDGVVCLYDRENDRFLAGMARLVQQKLQERGVESEVKREAPALDLPQEVPENILPGVTLRDYQINAARKALMAQGGIIQMPTASGKTVVAAAILKALNLPSIFLVNSIRLLRQTAQSFEKFGLRNVGVVGEGVFEPGYTTVAMVQTLNAAIKRRKSKAIHLLETADVLFADEMHHISSKSWENVALTTGAAIRYGLSGTPFRTRGLSRYEDWLVFGLCGEICYSIPTQMLVDRGYIARPRLFMLPVSEPRVNSFKDWHSVYDLGVVNHEGRNAAAKDVISRLLGRGLRVLVSVQRIEHGKAMIQDLHESGVSSVFLMGSDKIFRQGENGPVEDMDEVVDFTSKTVEDFRSGKYQVLIASPVLDEGIDLPEIEALVILSGGKSLIKIIQRLGRALRPKPGENEVFVVDFYDKHHPWLTSHSKKRYGEYTEEGHTVLHAADFDRAFPPMNGGTNVNPNQPWDSLIA